MQGMLVVTHGRLAEELVDSAKTIVGGPVEALEAVSIDWNDDVEEATERIRQAAERVDRGGGVVLLTDMFGGTPTNLALSPEYIILRQSAPSPTAACWFRVSPSLFRPNPRGQSDALIALNALG